MDALRWPESAQQVVSLQLLAQRCPTDAENRRGLGLVTLRVIHHGVEQGRLHFSQHEAIEFCRLVTVQILEIPVENFTGEITQWPLAMACQLVRCFPLDARKSLGFRLRHCTDTGGRNPPALRPPLIGRSRQKTF